MKRIFDITFSLIFLICFFIPVFLIVILSSFDTKKNGLFRQIRIGKNKREFTIFKIRTLNKDGVPSNFGKFLRSFKIDELPQLLNIFLGQMSFVGPRPELPNYFEEHPNYPDQLISLKPGLTGLASLYFINEDKLRITNDGAFFEDWLFQRKNTLNLLYYRRNNFCFDCIIIFKTIIALLKSNKQIEKNSLQY